MGDPIEKHHHHFGITKDRDPFTEFQVGGNDDADFLIELADQVEEECSTGFGE